ncbi:MAG: sigma-70 family RNA polymerase sigma factor [Oscillospiraceae bacterium]|nr:sigma-70 family RNA polymerase sigma factor [Oscillospiraceae bacterium]
MTDAEFRQCAERYGDTIFRVAFHSLKNRADAEDVMQTVLLRLYECQKPFENEDHVKHWLIRVAVNESRKLLRSFWRRNRLSLDEQTDQPVFDQPEQSDLFEAVMALPEKYRLAVYLYYYEDYPVRDIAEALHTNQSTVQTWLMRARQRLRDQLTPEGELT